MNIPDRGDLVTINFYPQSGHEQEGRRHAIVLSPKAFNEHTGFAIVCPTSNQEKGYPFEVKLPIGLKIEGVVLTDQVKSVDWQARRLKIVDKAPQEVVDRCLTLIHTFL